MSLKEKFIKYINDSSLTLDQKELWQLFIMKATSQEREAVLEAVSSDERNLKLLTEHLRDKILSMDDIKDDDWDDIAEEEEEFSEKI